MGVKRTDMDYFEMFVKGVQHALDAARMLKALLDDGRVTQERITMVKRIENEADTHMHTLCEQLNVAFITPIDRDDIYRIAKETDDITDSIERVANDLWVMHVDHITSDMRLMGQYVVDACEALVQLMSEIKHHKKSNKLNEYTVEINRIEELGDKCYKNAIYELFGSEKDPIALIKAQSVYKALEDALDDCEDVADCVEGIIITKT